MKVIGNYYQENGMHLVKLTFNETDERIFKVYSGRAGKTLALMAEKYPDGITLRICVKSTALMTINCLVNY